jgi:phosphoribosylformimino-5-aminoimidazole carboxamide ribonucleotide (ProFAR) isomerase
LVELGRGAIVAAGGIGSSADVAAARAVGCVGAIVGRAFYEGRLDPRRLVEELALPSPPIARSPMARSPNG